MAIESVSHNHFPHLGKICSMELVEKPAKLSLDPVAAAALKKAKNEQKRKEKEERKAKAGAGGNGSAKPKKEWKSKKAGKEKKENVPTPAPAASASSSVSVVVSTEEQLKAAKAAAVPKLEEAKLKPINDVSFVFSSCLFRFLLFFIVLSFVCW